MTTVVGVTMVKDEADIIEATLRHMLTQVDYVIVADNMSTDDTPKILDRLFHEQTGRLTVFRDEEVAYHQSKKMTNLAHIAYGELGADWIVPFDADEIWYSSFAPTLKEVLGKLGPQWLTVQAVLYDHVPTALDNAGDPNPVTRLRWRCTEPLELPKVACRWRSDLVIDYGNHRAFYDKSGVTTALDKFVVRHFPWRSDAQAISKARNGNAAYMADPELAENDVIGGHWKSYGQIIERSGEQAFLDNVYHRWFCSADPIRGQGRGPLIEDPAPVRG